MQKFREVVVKAIVVRERLRPLSQTTVDTIAESFAKIGQQQPIVIIAPLGKRPELVAGAHRLAAAKKLGWECINCIEAPLDASEDDLLLIQIDENLARGELSPVERAVHVQTRKEIYERAHPETKHGAAPGKAGGGKVAKDAKFASFAADTAAKTGQSVRKVQLDAHRATSIANIGDAAGTSLDKGDELDALAKLPPDKQAATIAKAKAGEKVSAKTEAKKHKRSEIERATAEKIVALPGKHYGVIYADPEWKFESYNEDTTNRGAKDHYAVSHIDDISQRDVASISAPDCALFLWATVPMLPQALQVMAAWGFTYKSHLVWVKDRIGQGYWNRNKHELLLIGTKGKIPAPAPGENPESAISAPLGAHSEKPEVFAEIIERMFPTIPKIELNRRGPARAGWDAWGAESVE